MVINPVTSGVRSTAVAEPIELRTSSTLKPTKVAAVLSSTVNDPTDVSTFQVPSIEAVEPLESIVELGVASNDAVAALSTSSRAGPPKNQTRPAAPRTINANRANGMTQHSFLVFALGGYVSINFAKTALRVRAADP